jgi:hypothetical protein
MDQGDDIRIIEPDPRRAELWKTVGAHVALGSPADVDLVERAAQQVRTIVVMEEATEWMGAIVEGAASAGVGRIVAVARQTSRSASILQTTALEWVLMKMPRRRLPSRAPRVDHDRIAEAIDAADDLAGPVHLELDLSDSSAWTALGLEPYPQRSRPAR